MFLDIEYSVCYFVNPVSNERLCLGVLVNERTFQKFDFIHIDKLERLRAFNDETDIRSVNEYLEALQDAVKENNSKPFVIEMYMTSPVTEIKFSEIKHYKLPENHKKSYLKFIANTYFPFDSDEEE